MKKIFALVLTLALLCTFSLTAYADCGEVGGCSCCKCGGCNGGAATKTPEYNCGQPVSCPVRITKQPVGEEGLCVYDRTSTYFLVYAENAVRYEWYCKIGKTGTPMCVRDAIDEYGLNVEGYDTNKLYIYALNSNGWDGIDGWLWMCRIYDCEGCYVDSNWVITTSAHGGPPPAPAVVVPPCVPVAPVCPTTGIVPTYPTTGCGGYGFGYVDTSFTTTTTTHTETDSTYTQTGHSFYFY